MSNFGEMQQNIADYILRNDLASQVRLGINRAIAKYSKNRFWFSDVTANFNTTQGTWIYTIPTIPDNIRRVYYHRIQVNNVYYHVNQRDIQYVIDANVNNNQGQPVDWAWFENSIYYYPVPQDTYPITLFYQKVYAPLVDATDENDFTTIPEAEDLIEAETLRWLYKRVILDGEKAAEYKQEALDALQVLNSINEDILGMEGYIKPSRW